MKLKLYLEWLIMKYNINEQYEFTISLNTTSIKKAFKKINDKIIYEFNIDEYGHFNNVNDSIRNHPYTIKLVEVSMRSEIETYYIFTFSVILDTLDDD